jgi:hypothetical protein
MCPYAGGAGRCQRGDEGARLILQAGARRHAGRVGGGVAMGRRQRAEDADALSLQQFRNERHGQIGVAAAGRIGGGDAAFLAGGLGGNDLGKPEAAEQIAQVHSGGPAHRGIAQRDGASRLQRGHEGFGRRDVGRRSAVAGGDADRSACDGCDAVRDERAGCDERIDRRHRENEHVRRLASRQPRLERPHRLEHDVGNRGRIPGECPRESRNRHMHRPGAKYLHHRVAPFC